MEARSGDAPTLEQLIAHVVGRGAQADVTLRVGDAEWTSA